MATTSHDSQVARNGANGRPARRVVRVSWRDPAFRSIAYQVVVVAAVVAVACYLVSNTLSNLAARNIATGFGFMSKQAGFAIGESVIDYSPSDTYARAVLVGLVNTLRVAIIALFLATILGVAVGIARLSTNWLIAKLSAGYVEFVRNIPLLLQLLIWYAAISELLPGARSALHPLPGVYVSNRGMVVPSLEGQSVTGVLVGVVCALLALIWVARRLRHARENSGRTRAMWPWSVSLLACGTVLGWLMTGRDFSIDLPKHAGFGFAGGWTLSPELFALLAGLVTYTAAFIGENVRSGIQSVGAGQWEAAHSIGLTRGRILRLVVMPQALRVIIPPTTSQYLNVVKNSSLAVAIGYPDLVAVVNTTLNQTGQAIEGFILIMAAYMTVSLSISVFMNWYNARMLLVER